MIAASVFLVYEQFAEEPLSRASSLALLALAVIASVFLVVLVRATWRVERWIRGPLITWQVLQVAAAWVILQGDMATALGWGLTILGALAFVLVLMPASTKALRRADEFDN